MQQLFSLLQKNVWLAFRGWRVTLVEIFNPIVFLLILFLLQKLYEGEQALPPNQDSITSNLPKCIIGPNQSKCFTLIYGPTDSLPNMLAEHIAATNDPPLSIGRIYLQDNSTGLNTTGSIDDLAPGEWPDIGGLASQWELEQFVLHNPNLTQNAVFFLGGSPLVYYVYNNLTAPEDPTTTAKLFATLDKAFAHVFNNVTLSVSASISGYPQPRSASQASDAVMKGTGPVWIYCPSMFNFILFCNQIVTEKERRTRMAMSMVGLKTVWYWLSWLITLSLIVLLNTLVLLGCGYLFQFTVISSADFSVNFVGYFIFAWTSVPLAFLISTFTSKASTASTICFLIFVLGFFLQIIFAGFSIYFWYKPPTSPAIHSAFEVLYAPFNFAKFFSDVNSVTSPSSTTSVTHKYLWADLFHPLTVQPFAEDDSDIFNVPATSESLYFMLANFGIYLLLTAFFDQVIPSAHAIAQPVYFFLTPRFWREAFDCGQAKAMEAARETDALLDTDSKLQNSTVAISVNNLLKVYRKCSCKGGELRAVDDLSFEIDNGKLCCILGKNGAGKTTTLSILSGLTRQTNGEAYIFGLQVSTQMTQIRNLIGICPQFDILYDDLTAEEHLRLFANLKKIPRESIEPQIASLLRDVNLATAAKHKAGTFSGGMRRRLSVAISLIGNPKVVFLDEPTTGMDPVSRTEVWRVIEKMKQGRVILLTTHLLNEADILSDVVAIMHKGKLACLGTSLELKNKHGAGYYFNVNCGDKPIEKIERKLAKLDGQRTVSNHAPFLVFSIPTEQIDAAREAVRALKNEGLIEGWSISHTTLEEVFLKVTGDEKDKAE